MRSSRKLIRVSATLWLSEVMHGFVSIYTMPKINVSENKTIIKTSIKRYRCVYIELLIMYIGPCVKHLIYSSHW